MATNSFKKLIMMANQVADESPSLPSHLERAEYLEATGTQYIDLGYPLGYYHRVVLIAETTDTTNTNYIFGNSINTSNSFALNSTNYTIQVQRFDGTTKSINLWREGKCTIVCDKEGISVDNEFNTWQKTPFEFITDGNCYLCAVNATTKYPYKGKIYSCQIYENDILIHDYIPCYNTENYRPCMYDTITGIELYNQGTGEFNYHIEGRPIPYLAFEALEDDLQVSITKSATQYSLDRVNWIDLPAEELTEPINKGEKVWFKANITPDGGSAGIGTFSCTKMCNLEGTPMSLLHGDRAGDYVHLPNKMYCFTSLFRNNDNIIRVNNPKDFLPAIVFTNSYCYQSMFYGCSNLVNMCYLPALYLTQGCYGSMYNRCSSLVEIFDFPEWTRMANDCCNGMFAYCTSIKKQPKITTKLDSTVYSCFNSMFAYCVNMEECQEVLQFTTAAQSSYNGMYRKTKIKKAPEIPAKVCSGIVASLMANMFNDCTELVEGPSNLYIETIGQSTYEGTFQNCYKLKKAPIVHQKTSGSLSNRYMFQNCIELDYIVLLQLDPFTNTATNDFTYWVDNVSPKGTIVLNKNIEWNPDDYRGTSSIPAGWEVKYCDPDNLDDIRDYR